MPGSEAETSPAVIRLRQLRGLVTHYRKNPDYRRPGQYRRSLIRSVGTAKKLNGICRWCGRPTGHSRKVWHPYCLNAYRIAKGMQHDIYDHPLIPPQDCTCGQPGQEIDHQTALSVAYALQDERIILRAYTAGNLQWLCSECHRKKSGRDRRKANNIRAGRPEDWVKPERHSVSDNQVRLF